MTEQNQQKLSGFDSFLRTGRWNSDLASCIQIEQKFNPYHDELGRFTFAHSARFGARMGVVRQERHRRQFTPRERIVANGGRGRIEVAPNALAMAMHLGMKMPAKKAFR